MRIAPLYQSRVYKNNPPVATSGKTLIEHLVNDPRFYFAKVNEDSVVAACGTSLVSLN